MKDSQQEYPNVTRVEMIDANGRAYTAYDATDVILALQDDGRTLKIMHTGTGDSSPTTEHVTSFGQDLNNFLQSAEYEELSKQFTEESMQAYSEQLDEEVPLDEEER